MADDTSQVKRTKAIEEVTNRYVIHPISRALVTHFDRWNVSPNAVSLMGMALGAGAAVAYYHYRFWPMALLGFLLMAGWHVMDGADGQLARLTGRSSELGEVLDGLCDHVTFVLVYAALALVAARTLGAWVWGAAALAGLSHAVQASAYEFQRQVYDFWVHGKSKAAPDRLEEVRQSLEEKRGLARLFGALHLRYLRLQHRVAAVDEPLQRRLSAARRRDDDAATDARLREAYRRVYLGGVRRWSLLCSNYRTLAIFLACLAGAPVLFFGFEIAVLNLVFVLLVRMKQRHNRALHAWLDEQEAPSAEFPGGDGLRLEKAATGPDPR